MTEDKTAGPTSFQGGARAPEPPPIIPDHELLRLIGSGSYGQVWLARNVMGYFRAVKVVYRGHFLEDRPYEREFEGIRRFEPVSHFPSQVNISHVGRNDRDGYFYYVMELADDQHSGQAPVQVVGQASRLSAGCPVQVVGQASRLSAGRPTVGSSNAGETPGLAGETPAPLPEQLRGQQIDPANYAPKTLRSEIKLRGRLPFNECLDLGLALTAALSHLHKKELVHRDIKPANVIFVNGQAKLADIGLVAAAEAECSFVGTEGYVPPEGPGGVQADIYALGKVLYQMSTGQDAAAYPSLPAGEILVPELQELNQVVNRACEANTTRRYKAVDEMAADLELLKNRKSLIRLRRLERTARLARAGIAVLVGLLVIGAVIGAGIVYWGAREKRMRQFMEFKLARIGPTHDSGWFTRDWPRLKQAARFRPDDEAKEQAVAMLAGFDAHPVAIHWREVGTSAAFNKQGEALVGGTNKRRALLLDTHGVVRRLAVRGEGLVCWGQDGAPLQLLALSNTLVLRDARDAAVRWQVPYDNQNSTGSPPVLAVTTDGDRVAASFGHRVSVWNTGTGDCLGKTEDEASEMAFSTDGSLLALGMNDGTTRIVTIPGMTPVRTLPAGLTGRAVGKNRGKGPEDRR